MATAARTVPWPILTQPNPTANTSKYGYFQPEINNNNKPNIFHIILLYHNRNGNSSEMVNIMETRQEELIDEYNQLEKKDGGTKGDMLIGSQRCQQMVVGQNGNYKMMAIPTNFLSTIQEMVGTDDSMASCSSSTTRIADIDETPGPSSFYNNSHDETIYKIPSEPTIPYATPSTCNQTHLDPLKIQQKDLEEAVVIKEKINKSRRDIVNDEENVSSLLEEPDAAYNSDLPLYSQLYLATQTTRGKSKKKQRISSPVSGN